MAIGTKKLTTQEFIDKATIIHNGKYTYENTVYTNAVSPVVITCPIHGDFTLSKARAHTNSKCGCPDCNKFKRLTQESFIEKANKAHNGFYSYEKTVVDKAHDKVTITCPIHGDFEQQAYVHIQKHGCPECGKLITADKKSELPDIWSYRGWEESGSTSKHFVGYSLYVIRCIGEGEDFLKIGKTFMPVTKRFNNTMPYKWTLEYLVQGPALNISALEKSLHAFFKPYAYIPTKKFHGSKECFNITIEEVLNELNTRTDNSIKPCET
jgi:hypothetical protein